MKNKLLAGKSLCSLYIIVYLIFCKCGLLLVLYCEYAPPQWLIWSYGIDNHKPVDSLELQMHTIT